MRTVWCLVNPEQHESLASEARARVEPRGQVLEIHHDECGVPMGVALLFEEDDAEASSDALPISPVHLPPGRVFDMVWAPDRLHAQFRKKGLDGAWTSFMETPVSDMAAWSPVKETIRLGHLFKKAAQHAGWIPVARAPQDALEAALLSDDGRQTRLLLASGQAPAQEDKEGWMWLLRRAVRRPTHLVWEGRAPGSRQMSALRACMLALPLRWRTATVLAQHLDLADPLCKDAWLAVGSPDQAFTESFSGTVTTLAYELDAEHPGIQRMFAMLAKCSPNKQNQAIAEAWQANMTVVGTTLANPQDDRTPRARWTDQLTALCFQHKAGSDFWTTARSEEAADIKATHATALIRARLLQQSWPKAQGQDETIKRL